MGIGIDVRWAGGDSRRGLEKVGGRAKGRAEGYRCRAEGIGNY